MEIYVLIGLKDGNPRLRGHQDWFLPRAVRQRLLGSPCHWYLLTMVAIPWLLLQCSTLLLCSSEPWRDILIDDMWASTMRAGSGWHPCESSFPSTSCVHPPPRPLAGTWTWYEPALTQRGGQYLWAGFSTFILSGLLYSLKIYGGLLRAFIYVGYIY